MNLAWLLLIVPMSVSVGFVAGAMLAAGGRRERDAMEGTHPKR